MGPGFRPNKMLNRFSVVATLNSSRGRMEAALASAAVARSVSSFDATPLFSRSSKSRRLDVYAFVAAR
jgi:hypothetical protein